MFSDQELAELREANEYRESQGGTSAADRNLAVYAFHAMDPEQDEALYVRTVRNFKSLHDRYMRGELHVKP